MCARESGALWRTSVPLGLLGLLTIAVLLPDQILARDSRDGSAVPGSYTIGLYADFEGSSRRLILPKGKDRFEAFIGITGDSTRVFSGLAFRVALPDGVTLDGPIVWRPLPGLKQYDAVEQRGTRVNFHESCVQSEGDMPVMIGRIPFRLGPDVKRAKIEPAANIEFGLRVELCLPDSYPKPSAQGLDITVERSLSLWDRITSWFD
jgi:hypothetical protein